MLDNYCGKKGIPEDSLIFPHAIFKSFEKEKYFAMKQLEKTKKQDREVFNPAHKKTAKKW